MPPPFGHSGIFQSQVSTRLFDGFRHRQFANGLLHRQSSFQAKVRKIYSYYTTPQVRKTLVRRKTRLYCLGSRDRRRSEIRNKFIARVLKEAELIEQWGRHVFARIESGQLSLVDAHREIDQLVRQRIAAK